jgi:hypothetical protein
VLVPPAVNMHLAQTSRNAARNSASPVPARGQGFPALIGRGSGDADSNPSGATENRKKPFKPIAFVRAEVTPRVLFSKEGAEDILKSEAVDLNQGTGLTARFSKNSRANFQIMVLPRRIPL